MNVHTLNRDARTTEAASGLPRHRWLVDDIFKMIETGLLSEDDRFELIGGEIVPMASKGNHHEIVKNALNRFLAKSLPDSFQLGVETTLYISEDTFLEPDFIVWPTSVKPITKINEVPAEELSLLIEISHSSLNYDLGRKREMYAALNVSEYWVINAMTLLTTVHREPKNGAYKLVENITSENTLSAANILDIQFALRELGLSPAA